MKTLVRISFALSLMFALASCNLKEALTTDVAINDKTISFDLEPEVISGVNHSMKVSPVINDSILFNQTFNLNVDSVLSTFNLSVDLIKSIALTQSTLEITVPEDYTDDVATVLNPFKTVKLYFDNTSNLVAKGESISISGRTGIIKITVLNAELLDKLKQDQFRVILVGTRPTHRVHCKLHTSYRLRVGLMK